ncbi:MAG: hypothetical protein GWN58_49340, partial [Anaerolineae bacterium]|nr:hypothetical protein [Anaerolineae bacterium]
MTLTGPWSDLPVLRSQGHPAVLLLHTESDGRIRLTHDLENFEDLVGRIKENVYPRMQQAYSQVFNRGQTLHFGPLSMDQRSLRVGRREYPWEQIMAAELHRGLLRIRLAGTEDGTLE